MQSLQSMIVERIVDRLEDEAVSIPADCGVIAYQTEALLEALARRLVAKAFEGEQGG